MKFTFACQIIIIVLAPDPAYCCSLKQSAQGHHSVIDRGGVGHHGYPLQEKEGRGRSGKLTITEHLILQPKKTANILSCRYWFPCEMTCDV